MLAHSSSIKIIDPQFLCTAYSNGYFPMADSNTGEISWFSPDPRTIFELDEFHIPRSLLLTLKKNDFEVSLNKRFEEVMRSCAEREVTWISETIIQSYLRLHHLGLAHSVETWKGGSLIGGLYGVAIHGAFFGESMFSRRRDGSKIALVHLVRRLKERGFLLLDTQYITPHLKRFGAREIPRSEYMKHLADALTITCSFTDEDL
ncbi:MAG: leucyl/phenylalanyl-tRNA--protein transferase [Ignavibacteriae bacterium]|nr:MAG: leucyl/phenylalanyl-tRNA--protein transferase [Ignavibacteriota bacterium]